MRRLSRRSQIARLQSAVALRKSAIEFAVHLHDEPKDDNDKAGQKRWDRLALAAYEFARATGALPWVPTP